MSRTLSTANENESEEEIIEVVLLVKFEFDTPVYVHSNVANIGFDGNVYTGVGDLGAVGGLEETETLSPNPVTFELSGLVPGTIAEALDAGNFGDRIECYMGFMDTTGELVDDPVLIAAGTFDHADIEFGDQTRVVITMQHDLARLRVKAGRRWTDEDHRQYYPDDTFFAYIHRVGNRTLLWGGQPNLSRMAPGSGYDGANGDQDRTGEYGG